MAATLDNHRLAHFRPQSEATEVARPLEFPGVFRGRELTRKDRKLASGIDAIDRLLGGGIVRGRISEFTGLPGAGKTSLAMAFAARITRLEAAAWIETGNSLDPASMIAAGIEPARTLWVAGRLSEKTPIYLSPWSGGGIKAHKPVWGRNFDPEAKAGRQPSTFSFTAAHASEECLCSERVVESASCVKDNSSFSHGRPSSISFKAAEWILTAGGFGLVVIDFASDVRFIPISSVLRLARAAEQSGSAVIVMAERRVCGTFAALSLRLSRKRNYFSRTRSGAPPTFDGNEIEAQVMRNKLGGVGASAAWRTTTDFFANPIVPIATNLGNMPAQLPFAESRTFFNTAG